MQAPAAAAAASSRFRVVKLDSGSEPFRKGRWTCAEYYDKDSVPPAPPATSAAPGPAESLRQPPPEGVTGPEWDGTSGSSVSTLSHYTESVGSGDMDHGQAPSHPSAAPPQDVMTPLPKTHIPAPQQMSYLPPGVPPAPVQVGYPPAQQPPLANPTHVMPATQGAGMPPDFAQHPPLVRPTAPGMPHLMAPSATASGNAPPPASLPQGPLQPQGPSPQIAPPSQVAGPPQMLPGNVSEVPQPLTRPLQPPPEQPPPPGTQPPPAPLTSSQVTSSVPPRSPAPPPPTSSLYAGLPSFTATQLQDAQRLLFQHQSLFSLPKLGAAERASEPGAALRTQDGNGALPVSAGLFPLKGLPVDGEEDR